jgi:hypothetical protein
VEVLAYALLKEVDYDDDAGKLVLEYRNGKRVIVHGRKLLPIVEKLAQRRLSWVRMAAEGFQ